MAKRASPAVRFPMRRSPLLHKLWLLVVVASALLVLLWLWQGAGHGTERWMRGSLGVALWLLCTFCGWRGLVAVPQGALHWTGRCWQWEADGQTHLLSGSPQVILDLQNVLVLRFQHVGKGALRCVLQRDCEPLTWTELRRAVYSSAHPTQVAPTSEVP